NRRHHLHRPQILLPLHLRHIRQPNPRRLPLRAPFLLHRLRPSDLLPRPRRRLVPRRHHPPRYARHGIQPLLHRRLLLRPFPNRHGGLDPL
ncbi:MAG: hypothetical protein Q9210_007512, partial [Variospora velana]